MKSVESGERLKNDNRPAQTRPENRQPICANWARLRAAPARQLSVAVETIRQKPVH
jgi:hypothetical protein